jgi:probable DNA metabolism protein
MPSWPDLRRHDEYRGGIQMHFIMLDHDTDFEGWRKAARTLALNDVSPSDVTWSAPGHTAELFAPVAATSLPEVPQATFSVSAKFVELAQSAILHRDTARFAILYRLLWRLRGDHDLLAVATDPDVSQVAAMAKAVHRDQHKMQAFVRFREIGRERTSRYVAWYEPEHHIVEATAPFFARRFADMAWSILTPDICAHWEGHVVAFTLGVSKAAAPSEDRLEETWLRYYASIFNPARLKVKAMQTEMPKKYWRNLPEASLIKPLIAGAGRATSAMIADAATDPHKSQKRPEPSVKDKQAASAGDIEALRQAASDCRACPLWHDATACRPRG